jgi:hypothetical protein
MGQAGWAGQFPKDCRAQAQGPLLATPPSLARVSLIPPIQFPCHIYTVDWLALLQSCWVVSRFAEERHQCHFLRMIES